MSLTYTDDLLSRCHEMLSRLEWSGRNGNGHKCCPSCYMQSGKHHIKCELKSLINELAAVSVAKVQHFRDDLTAMMSRHDFKPEPDQPAPECPASQGKTEQMRQFAKDNGVPITEVVWRGREQYDQELEDKWARKDILKARIKLLVLFLSKKITEQEHDEAQLEIDKLVKGHNLS